MTRLSRLCKETDGSSLHSPFPFLRVPLHMEYRKNDYPGFFNYEKDGKRKSSRQCATNVSVDLGIDVVISEDRVEGGVQNAQEFRTKSGDAGLIPAKGLCDVCFSLRSDHKLASHARF